VNDYDVIVLDWRLPGKDGLAVCRTLRTSEISTPILMLTARDSIADRVSGLRTGADDYLTKPFAFDELLARISALLRRSRIAQPAVLQVSDLTLDPISRRVTRGGSPITLTPKEYAILAHVSHLRRKIDREVSVPLIQTVRGVGYRLGPEDA
jgi:DNA-binding response OmpR family regulator